MSWLRAAAASSEKGLRKKGTSEKGLRKKGFGKRASEKGLRKKGFGKRDRHLLPGGPSDASHKRSQSPFSFGCFAQKEPVPFFLRMLRTKGACPLFPGGLYDTRFAAGFASTWGLKWRRNSFVEHTLRGLREAKPRICRYRVRIILGGIRFFTIRRGGNRQSPLARERGQADWGTAEYPTRNRRMSKEKRIGECIWVLGHVCLARVLVCIYRSIAADIVGGVK